MRQKNDTNVFKLIVRDNIHARGKYHWRFLMLSVKVTRYKRVLYLRVNVLHVFREHKKHHLLNKIKPTWVFHRTYSVHKMRAREREMSAHLVSNNRDFNIVLKIGCFPLTLMFFDIGTFIPNSRFGALRKICMYLCRLALKTVQASFCNILWYNDYIFSD